MSGLGRGATRPEHRALSAVPLVVVALVACRQVDAARPAPPLASTSMTAPPAIDAGAAPDAGPETAAPAVVVGFVTFDGPPYVRETPMHGGPAWSLHAAKLPARIRSSDAIVIASASERGLSSVPNLTVRFLSSDGARVERAVELLTAREFDLALATGEAGKSAAFAQLGDTVRARVVALNRELDALGGDVLPLDACAIDPSSPYADWPPCGAAQSIRCGAVSLRYLGGRQTLETPRGRRTFPTWRKPKARSNDGAEVIVNECVGAAWLDPDAKILALHVANLCAVPGDWCSVESDWRFVRLDR